MTKNNHHIHSATMIAMSFTCVLSPVRAESNISWHTGQAVTITSQAVESSSSYLIMETLAGMEDVSRKAPPPQHIDSVPWWGASVTQPFKCLIISRTAPVFPTRDRRQGSWYVIRGIDICCFMVKRPLSISAAIKSLWCHTYTSSPIAV